MRALGLLACLATFTACSSETPTPQPPPPPPSASGSASVAPPPPPPFENPGGMWQPRQIPALAADLRRAGWALEPEALSDLSRHPLGAVVSLGGCSASFVSKDGLVATNHHCVTGALQAASQGDERLSETGFAAKTRADERWAGAGTRVFVTEKLEDVTEKIRGGLEAVADPAARYAELEKRTKAVVKACEDGQPARRCTVVPFYGTAEWVLVQQLELRDVRLVFAPPGGVGDFGGDVDNFRWPRHAGDFAFYRVYVGKDQKPADHGKDNVPYQPKHWLQVADEPLRPGAFVAVAGYPGSTDRLRTASDMEFAASWQYLRRVSMCDDYIALQTKLSKGDKALERVVEDLVKGLDNGRTFFKGVLDGFEKGGVLAKKRAEDADLRRRAAADPALGKVLGDALDRIDALLEKQRATRDGDADVSEAGRLVKLVGAANTLVRLAEEREKPDAERDPAYQQRNEKRLREGLVAISKRFDRRIDEPTMELAVERALRREGGKASPLVVALFGGKVPEKDLPAAAKKAVHALYEKTKLGVEKDRLALFDKAKLQDHRRSADPMIKLALALRPSIKAAEDRDKALSGEMLLLRPRYVAALRKGAGRELASDANGTLRVTFGTVRGYRPTPDAAVYEPFSTLAELVKKANGKAPFDAPKALLDAKAAGKLGPWKDEKLGDVPVDFLSDLDTTGGNSGSPTIDAHGRLVGLLFDGNYEAMASDWVFLPTVTRSIHVDIRYVLWVLDLFGGDAILEELGKKPSL